MHERTRAILEASIGDFIETGKPVTSDHLYTTYDFGIKPAMIRWELNDLADAGYFYQEHPSGGRYPTAKAYRFFAHNLLNNEALSVEPVAARTHAAALATGELRALAEHIAGSLGLLGVAYAPRENGAVYESGLGDLIAHFEESDHEDLVAVARDVDAFATRIVSCMHVWDAEDALPWPRAFIGKSDIARSGHLSAIVSCVTTPRGECVIAAIGPMRMDYRRSVQLFRSLERALETHGERHV